MNPFQCPCGPGVCAGLANCRNATVQTQPFVPAQPPLFPAPFSISSPRVLPVNLPISCFGVTIAILDGDGNLTIKIDQPRPAQEQGV